MKTHYSKYAHKIIKTATFILAIFAFQLSFSQEKENDTIKGSNLGKLKFDNPKSIVEAYTYDPKTDRYIYTQTFDGFNINHPLVLTPKEYQELILRENMREYFKKKSDAIDGVKEGSEEAKRDLLPKYYVNSSFFETIFGGNTIDVKPTGSVEIDLGMRHTKQDNPSISPRNRKTTTFDFNQRISVGLKGKVGTRLNVNANYDTQSTFNFQNLFKLEYAPTEDDIIQKIEVGNVSMPLNSTLIRGAQSLFGVKAQLQFGKTTFTGVYSEQKSQTKSVTAQGGGTVQEFSLFAQEYDADRHFFLSQYFRNKYDSSLKNYPFINSRVQITRVEVWVTNKQNRINATNNNLRNIIALQDLGESELTVNALSTSPAIPNYEIVTNRSPLTGFFTAPVNTPPDNGNNLYNPELITTNGGLLNTNIREIVTSDSGFNNTVPVNEGTDYSKLENARKLLPNEFTFHPQLGYISLQQRLANDEVLAVAYQYTVGPDVYQVGEFGTDGVEATQVDPSGVPSSQALILKMLKSSLTSVDRVVSAPGAVPEVRATTPVWNLMMKNIYQLPGAYQLQQEDFKFNVLYADPSPINYIVPVAGTSFPPNPTADNQVADTPLLKVFNMDKLNYNNDPQDGGDGFFDFIPGLTVDQQNGRIIFTTVEPFGSTIFEKLRTNPTEVYTGDVNSISDFNENQKKYVFRKLYKGTQAQALQESDKNKYQLKGKFKSSGGDGIPIGAFNVPKGSVVVSAGGRTLVEGVDYTVNYQAGRVQILDPSLKASNTPINVSVENNSLFGQKTRRFYGFNVEHKFSDKFVLGGTYLKMTERPFTQKSDYGQESVNNTIYGVNGSYSTEVPFLTRLVNKLPNIDTDVPSNVSLRAEVAFLQPGTPKGGQFNGEPTIFIDDFEGSQTTIDLKSPYSWYLSSTPERPTSGLPAYNDFGGNNTDLSYGYKRAKIAWYTIDPIFYTQRPSGISEDDLVLNSTRRVLSEELYPNTQIAVGQSQVVNTLDLTYYPKERGPYNFNPAATPSNLLPTPEDNFGGIVRSLNSTNFQQNNVEYIQFWMLDPYTDGRVQSQINTTNTGKLFFNLGEVSEDVLKDGRKFYENGVGGDQITTSNLWGDVPASQSLIYAFDSNQDNRTAQDVGLNGLSNAQEAAKFPTFANFQDPAADDYNYFLNTDGDIFNRYKNYNGLEGNSPIEVTDTNRGSTTVPDVEDINRDNTMNTINAYYEYGIDISPIALSQTGVNHITDIKDVQVTLSNNETTTARWIQFKIPVTGYDNTVGSISDFLSIRFMRMFMTGFKENITVRLGSLDLVRGEWRRYANTLDQVDTNVIDDNTDFDVLALNIQENEQRSPIPYVSPPGVDREQLYNNNTLIAQNEQSLGLRVSGDGLQAGDSRAVFKNISVDMRQYKKLKMFLHAEALASDHPQIDLVDNEMVGFIRFGNDFTDNFYQVEIPLKRTSHNTSSQSEIWPDENQIDLSLSLLTQLKILAKNHVYTTPGEIYYKNEDDADMDPSLSGKNNKLKLGIRGNPNFGLVRTLMVGVKNANPAVPGNPDGGRKIKGEAWFNELRMSEMDNKGGMAGIANLDGNIADFATVSATGKMSTIGFGTLEQGPNERSRDDIKQYNIVTNLSLGKLLPKKWGINLPFNYSIGEEITTPKYDPFNQDIELKQLLDVTSDAAERSNIKNRAIDFTKRKSINFIGVKKERGEKQKSHFYDPENLTLSYSYNQVERHNYEIENFVDQQVTTTADYTFAFNSKPVEPLKTVKTFKKSDYWKLLSDFNFNYLPSNISFSSNINRQFNKQQFRLVDVEGLGLDPLYKRNFLFNYQYGFNYNLTKSLKLNFNGTSNNIVRNYLNEFNQPNNSYTIWTDYWNIGSPNTHTQQLGINYDLPINKIPFLSFIKSSYTYAGNYSWQKSSLAMSSITDESTGKVYDLGNMIQNSGNHKLNTTFTMETFYKYIGLSKTKKPAAAAPKTAPKPGEKVTNNKPQVADEGNIFLNGLKGVLTSLKTVGINYSENRGTALPGYTPSLGFFGTAKPSLGFVFGSQDDVRYEAAQRGWLTKYPDYNQSYTQITTRALNFTANMELFPGFTVDWTADRTYGNNFSEQYDVSADGQYNSRAPHYTGNFAISTVMLKTAFRESDEFNSSAFDDFRGNRLIIANRLAEAYYGGTNYSLDAEGYPVGFGKNNQAVLMPAFLAAYTGVGLFNDKKGESAGSISTGIFRDIPIPNWVVKYTGLMRYKFFKDNFKSFSINHSYKSSYTLNSYRSNLDYSPGVFDNAGNLLNETIVGNINLVEQFSPLIKIDFLTKSSFKFNAEMKKDRALSLSFDNNLLTEVKGKEYIAGFGYRFKDVIFSTKLSDDPSGVIKGDINLKIDFSYRNNKTIIRYLDYDHNQLGGGQNIWSAKLTADYSLSKNFTVIFYYDHSFNKAVISTSFPMTNIRSGFTLRYNFGN